MHLNKYHSLPLSPVIHSMGIYFDLVFLKIFHYFGSYPSFGIVTTLPDNGILGIPMALGVCRLGGNYENGY